MLKNILKIINQPVVFVLFTFFIYTSITLVIFSFRLPHILTQYAMPDVDTDGGLWYQWFSLYSSHHGLLYDLMNYVGYPFGYDGSLSPSTNLTYSIQMFFVDHFLGLSWESLVFVTNISSLITYPLSAISAYLLCYYVTRNKAGSFIAGIIFSFSFYHIYMGRGQMSINHIEIIPFYILSLFYFLNKRSFFSLIFSVLTFSVLFMADAYYAFFCGLFSFIIIFFYQSEKFVSKVKIFLTYYSALFIIFFLINFSFVVSNLYLFDKAQAALTGRNSLPRNELTDVLYYFSAPQVSLISKSIPFFGDILYNIPVFIALAGFAFLKKTRLYIICLLCFLLAVVLSSYIPSLFWVNNIYFKYFGMFRGVGRLALPGYLFLGLLVGMVISDFMKTKIYQKHDKRNFSITYLLLCVLVIVASLNIDTTWYRNTDFAKTANLYTPLKNNKSIHVIAAYPIELNFDDAGFPQMYQLMAQIIHQKQYANGATLGSPKASDYQKSIKNIADKDTISKLAHYDIDTIVIYNYFVKNSSLVNRQLRQDPRLTYLGSYKESYDNGYISAIDRSRDISVYQIRKVVANNRSTQALFFIGGSQKSINYKEIEPGKFVITLDDVTKNERLVFNFPYSDKWQLFNGNVGQANDISFLTNTFNPLDSHGIYDEHMNSWQIGNNSSPKIHQFTLYFRPISMVYLGKIITDTTFILCIIFLILSKVSRKKTSI